MSASSPERPGSLEDALRRRFGDRCRLDAAGRRLYGYDAMGTAFGMPSAVVQMETAEEVQELVRIVASHGGHIVARGSGTGLSGGSIPLGGAVVASFERMRELWDLDPLARSVRAQPGVVNGSLEGTLRPKGLYYPPDPASYRVSSIGGNIAENAGGPHAVKYGVTGQHLRSLEVVTADGVRGWLHAGPVQPGSDLVALMTGSEGTLGLVTAAQLQLQPSPEEIVTLLVSFRDMERATDFVSAVVASGLLPATLEFMDRPTIAAIEEWGAARYPEGAGAVLLLEFDGAPAEVAEDLAKARGIAEDLGAIGVEAARDPQAREALWYGRRGAYAAVARHARRIFTQDVTVPRARLTEMLREVERIAGRYGIHVTTKGHAGDGNLHPDFPYDPDDPEDSARIHAASAEVMAACIRLGGSITGEHGVGIEKMEHMAAMFSPAELGLMSAVRRALDPCEVLNPGKAIPQAPREAPQATEHTPGTQPESAEELRALVVRAAEERKPLLVSLDGLRFLAVDRENLTAEVGAGVEIAELQAALEGTGLGFLPSPLRAKTLWEALLFNDYGPEHRSFGTLRSHLLAATYVTGRGELVRMGRGVVKNVAGYDLFRLLIGSQGRLGVPAALTLRLMPVRRRPWFTRQGDLEESLGEASGAQAVFCVPEGEGYRTFAQAASAPGVDWLEAPNAPKTLSGLGEATQGRSDVLDLALPPAGLRRALASGVRPIVLLPFAARIIARADEPSARAVALALCGEYPLRADYGPARSALAPPQGLAGAWEERLRETFDPWGVLATWTLGEAGA